MEWTELMLSELRQQWESGASTGAIAACLGISKNAVVGKAHRLGLASRPSPITPRLSQETREEIDRLLRRGMGASEIAARCGTSVRYMNELAKKYREPPLPRTPVIAADPLPVAVAVAASIPAAESPSPRVIREAPIITQGCCWPMWGFGKTPTHIYCGEPRPDTAAPYCATHRAKAFVQRNLLVAA